MTDRTINVALNLDSADYVQGLQSATAATVNFNRSLGALGGGGNYGPLGFGNIRAMVGPINQIKAAFSDNVSAAMDAQKAYSGLAATQAVTGQSASGLERQINTLAKSFPIGQQGALAMVQTLQQIGLTGKNQIGQIGQLSKTFVELGAATGESSTQLAAGLTSLTRLMTGNTLDPARVQRFSDALLNLSKNSGVSATTILEFSNQIGPVAHSLGIGTTAVMGMSAALGRLSDSSGAGVVLNKMMTDINSSVVEGTQNLGTYAQILGKTSTQFKSSFQANPTGTINQVFTQLGTMNPAQAQRYLDQLGMNSPRYVSAIQGLVQQGGFAPQLAQAQAGYGSGATQRAAQAAFNNLSDTLTKVKTTTELTAEALGAPLLGPLNSFAQLLGHVGSVLNAVFTNPVVQEVMRIGTSWVAPVVGGLGLAWGARKAVGAIGLVGQMATSGPATAGRVGRAIGESRMALAEQQFGIAGAIEGMTGFSTKDYLDVYQHAHEKSHGKVREALEAAADQYGPSYAENVLAGGGSNEEGGSTMISRINAARYGYGQGRAERRMHAREQALANMDTETGKAMRDLEEAKQHAGWVKRLALGAQQVGVLGVSTMTQMFRAPFEQANKSYILRTGSKLLDPTVREAMAGHGVKESANQLGRSVASHLENLVGISGGSKQMSVKDAWEGLTSSLHASKHAVDEVTTGMKGLHTAGKGFMGTLKDVGKFLGSSGIGSGVKSAGAGLMGMIGGSEGLIGMGVGAGTAALSYGLNLYDKIRTNETNYGGQGSMDIYGVANKYADALGSAGIATQTFADQANKAAASLAGSAAGGSSASVMGITPQVRAAARGAKVVNKFTGDSTSGLASQIAAIFPNGATAADLTQVQYDLVNAGYSDQQINSAMQTYSQQYGLFNPATGQGPSPLAPAKGVTPGLAAGMANVNALVKRRGPGFWNRMGSDVETSLTSWQQGGAPIALSSFNKDAANNLAQLIAGIGQTAGAQAPVYGSGYATQQAFAGFNQLGQAALAGGNRNVMADFIKRAWSAMMGPNAKGIDITPDMLNQFRASGGNVTQFFEQNYADAAYGGTKLSDWFKQGVTGIGAGGAGAQVTLQPSIEQPALTGTSAQFQSLFAPGSKSALAQAAQSVEAGGGPTAQAQFLKLFYDNMGNLNDILKNGAKDFQTFMDNQQNLSDAFRQLADQIQQQLLSQMQTAAQMTPGGTANVALWNKYSNMANSNDPNQVSAGVAGRQQVVASIDQQMKDRLMAYYNYQKEVTRSNQDFATNQLREYADFANQLNQQAQQNAASLISPYQRVTAQATWDAKDLIANMNDQNKTFGDQVKNIKTLEKEGLSTSAAQILNLTDPNNAQQVAELVANAANDPRIIKELNATANQRTGIFKALLTDPANLATKQMTDNFNVQMGRQVSDHELALKRMEEDLNDSFKVMSGTWDQLAHALKKAMRGAMTPKDWQAMLTDPMQTTIDAWDSNKKIYEGMKSVADTLQGLLTTAANDGIQTGLQQAQASLANWQPPTSFPTITTPGGPVQYSGGVWPGTGPTSANAAQGPPPPANTVPGGGNEYGGDGTVNVPGLATGGMVTQAMLAHIGEAGREIVLPLDNPVGIDALAHALTIAMAQMSQGPYAGGYNGHGNPIWASGRNPAWELGTNPNQLRGMPTERPIIVNNNQSYHYDQSARMTGPVNVEATDPNHFVQAAAAKARRDRVGAGRAR